MCFICFISCDLCVPWCSAKPQPLCVAWSLETAWCLQPPQLPCGLQPLGVLAGVLAGIFRRMSILILLIVHHILLAWRSCWYVSGQPVFNHFCGVLFLVKSKVLHRTNSHSGSKRSKPQWPDKMGKAIWHQKNKNGIVVLQWYVYIYIYIDMLLLIFLISSDFVTLPWCCGQSKQSTHRPRVYMNALW